MAFATERNADSAAPTRITAITQAALRLAGRRANLEGRRIGVLNPEPGAADALAQTLRQRGAQVAVLSLDPAKLARIETLDPEVIVVEPQHFTGVCWETLAAIFRHPQLRWSCVLVSAAEQVTSDGLEAHDLSGLCAQVQLSCADYDAALARARSADEFEAALEVLGPARALRLLLSAGKSVRAQFRTRALVMDVDLAEGLIVGAQGGRGRSSDGTLLGTPGLNELLRETHGVVSARAVVRPAVTNIMSPLDTALAAARHGRSPEPAVVQRTSLPDAPARGTSLPARERRGLPEAGPAADSSIERRSLPADAAREGSLSRGLPSPPALARRSLPAQGELAAAARGSSAPAGVEATSRSLAPRAGSEGSAARGLPAQVGEGSAPRGLPAPAAELARGRAIGARTLIGLPVAVPAEVVPARASAPRAASVPAEMVAARASRAPGVPSTAPRASLVPSPAIPSRPPENDNGARVAEPSRAPEPLHAGAQSPRPPRSLAPRKQPWWRALPRAKLVLGALTASIVTTGLYAMLDGATSSRAARPDEALAASLAAKPAAALPLDAPSPSPAANPSVALGALQPGTPVVEQLQAPAAEPNAAAPSSEAQAASAEAELASAASADVESPRVSPRAARQASALARRGDASLRRKHAGSAKRAYDAALRADPNNERALAGRARLALQEEDAANALLYATRLARAQADSASAQLLLGDAAQLAGDVATARGAWSRAAKLGAKEARARLRTLR